MSATSENRVRLISQGFNTWKVQILFPDSQISAAEISNRLREVKAELASHFGMSDKLLEYTKLLSKQETRQGLVVQILITKQPIPSGAPKFRALAASIDDGTTISDMRIEADIFPYDEFEQRLTRQSIEARLRTEGYDIECVDWKTVQEVLDRAEENLAPVNAVTIGRGVFPHSGQSSRLTYGIGAGADADIASAWMGVRPVVRGEFLLEASPATGGHGFGRNIYGRELEPRRGVQTVLAAGKGTRLVTRGAQLIADRDGLLLFKRLGRDKRDRDTYDMTPAKIVAHVVEAGIFREALRFDLDLLEPAMIFADIDAESRIVAAASLFIDGNVGEGAVIECTGTLRITGHVNGAIINGGQHICVHGDVTASDIRAELTLQVQGRVSDSALRATDVIAGETEGGTVEALHRTSIEHIVEAGGAATAIRVNLHRFLEQQQSAGRAALEELTVSMNQILAIFGPEIAYNVTDGTAQRMLLKWLRQQKASDAVSYTHAEVQEFRSILEMIPMIRAQLQAIGMELRDVTARLEKTPSTITSEPSKAGREA